MFLTERAGAIPVPATLNFMKHCIGDLLYYEINDKLAYTGWLIKCDDVNDKYSIEWSDGNITFWLGNGVTQAKKKAKKLLEDLENKQ